MRILKSAFAAALAAVVTGGCGDDAGSTGVSPDLTPVRGASPYLAAAATQWQVDPPPDADDGRQLYLATCAACHGATGHGLPHQGPDLRSNGFLARSSDAALQAFLVTGRPVTDPKNLSGLPMPPRGGNSALTDRHLGQIVNYLRTINAAPDGAQLGSASSPAHPGERP